MSAKSKLLPAQIKTQRAERIKKTAAELVDLLMDQYGLVGCSYLMIDNHWVGAMFDDGSSGELIKYK